MARVLFRLRRDRARVVGTKDDEASFDTDIVDAHERVGGYVEADLLHRDECTRACDGRACRDFHGSFFIDRPFYIYIACATFGDRFKDFRRWRTGIPADDFDTCGECSERDRFVPHQKFFHIFLISILLAFGWRYKITIL